MSTFSFYVKFNSTPLKSRLDAVLSYGSNSYFDERRKKKEQKQTKCRLAFPAGALIIFWRKAEESQYKATAKRVPKFALNCGSDYLTGLYQYNEKGLCFGDIPHSNDLLIFNNQLITSNDGVIGGFIEMWVCENKLNEKDVVLQMLDDGILDDELDAMRVQATAEPQISNEPQHYINGVCGN